MGTGGLLVLFSILGERVKSTVSYSGVYIGKKFEWMKHTRELWKETRLLFLRRVHAKRTAGFQIQQVTDLRSQFPLTFDLQNLISSSMSLRVGLCWIQWKLPRGEVHFLHIKPYNKGIYDHIRCSTALLWQTMQSWELEFVADVTTSWKKWR